MPELSPGMRIIIRDEEWMVKKVEINSLGGRTLHCAGVSRLVRDRDAVFLADLEDIEPVDPARVRLVPDDSPFLRRSRLFIESQWRRRIPTDGALHIGDRAAMDLMPYQLEPARIALGRLRQRILIADAVGLGKTLEAGILLSELIVRGKGRRILVVTVKSMMAQFQKELWNRFTIPLVRLDSHRIQRIRARLPASHNPFFHYDKTIVSIDTLKRDAEYRTHLENAWWDIIVIDEAHNVAERGDRPAQRARLAQLLSERSDTLILLSATPHDGRSESFASLMNMLDPAAIPDPKHYGREDIEGLCVRRFKRDVRDQVEGAFRERAVRVERCKASPEEERAFSLLAGLRPGPDGGEHRAGGALFRTSLEKAMFSSPAACARSVRERLRRLARRGGDEPPESAPLTELLEALEAIAPPAFSRYGRLLRLLGGAEYGWDPKNPADRVVIFTERIETMRFLAGRLEADLPLPPGAVGVLHGGMSDSEQQRVVEEFGREEAALRVLVASDVASEGINLHYLCHRLIHFDIPWSLMVFQQRNGRVDRYGQSERPDIRYFLAESENERIGGDLRVIEILLRKEEQAYRNLGDPALFFGKFDVGEEERMTAEAIERGLGAEAFERELEEASREFDPLELLMAGAAEKREEAAPARREETLFTDIGYLRAALSCFAGDAPAPCRDLETVEGLEIELTPELSGRLAPVLPEEALPASGYLRLSPDKRFCMAEMRRALRQDLSETAWPAVQYLWPLHPVFDWAGDRAGLLFGRGEAPLIGLRGSPLGPDEYVFLVAGSISNRRAVPVVDEWFGLRFCGGAYQGELPMERAVAGTGLGAREIPNRGFLPPGKREAAEALLGQAIAEAKAILARRAARYRADTDEKIGAELDKLVALEERHLEAIRQLSLYERKKSAEERRVEALFENLRQWVRDTLEIGDDPYLRVVAVVTGG